MRIECNGAFRKSGSPNVRCCAPAATSCATSFNTDASSATRTRPSYTTGTGQCRQRCAQPRLASTDPTTRSSPWIASCTYRSSGGSRRGGRRRLGRTGTRRPELYRRADPAAADPGHERVLVLARDHRVGDVAAHRGVEPVATDRLVDGGGELADEAGGGVHRHRERDAVGPLDECRVPRVDRRVERAHLVPACAKTGRGRGEVHGLVPELVGRDEEDAHRTRLRWFCSWQRA